MKLEILEKKYKSSSRLDRIVLLGNNIDWLIKEHPARFVELTNTIPSTYNEYLEFNSNPDMELTNHAARCLNQNLRLQSKNLSHNKLYTLIDEYEKFQRHVSSRIVQAEFYANLCYIMLNRNDRDRASEYGKLAYNLIGNKQLSKTLKTFYSNYGLSLIYTNDYEKAKEVLTLGLAKNYDHDKMIAEKLHMHLGLLYRNQQKYKNALEEFLTAEKLHDTKDVSGTVILTINKATIYTYSGDCRNSVKTIESIFNLAAENELDESAQINLIQGFSLYVSCTLRLQDFEKSQNGLELMEYYLGKYEKAEFYEDFYRLSADAACVKGDYDRALQIYERAYSNQKESGNISVFFLQSYTNFLLFMKHYEDSLNIIEETLSKLKSDKTTPVMLQSLEYQIAAYKGLGKYKKAFEILERVNTLQKETTSNDLKSQIEELISKNKAQQQQLKEKEKRISLFNQNFVDEHNIDFIGTSSAIKEVIEKATIAAQHPDINILINGESGTGKELIAKFIHFSSNVDLTVFQEVNCSAIPETMLESEFFGYKKGAFTGAVKDNPGFISSADKGTLFLDEIGDLPLNLQPKLLKVLEEKKFTPLGANKSKTVTFRLISATNRNLAEMVHNSEFRDDLFNRINSLVIEIPPLRKRKADIIPLVEHFLDSFTKEFNMLKPEIDDKTKDILLSYSYPGNVRELKNIIERTMIFVRQGESFYNSLKKHGFIYNIVSPKPSGNADDFIFKTNTLNMEENEKGLVLKALELSGNHKSKAAKLLDITPSALSRRLKKFNIDQ